MKPKEKGKICFVIYIAGERKLFFIIYDVIVKQKKEKSSANHYSCGATDNRHSRGHTRGHRHRDIRGHGRSNVIRPRECE